MTIHDLGVPAERSPHGRLKRLGIVVPAPPPLVANFLTHVQVGKLLLLSEQGPREPDGRLHTGKVGEEVTAQEAYAHARLTGINLLAVMQDTAAQTFS